MEIMHLWNLYETFFEMNTYFIKRIFVFLNAVTSHFLINFTLLKNLLKSFMIPKSVLLKGS